MKRLHLGFRDPEETVFDGGTFSFTVSKVKLNCSSSSLGLSRFPVGFQVRLILLDPDVRRINLLQEPSSRLALAQ